jgi:glycosyltransferase involved in cell wall biosynthesis
MVDRNLNAILIGHDDKPNDLADAIRPLLSDSERYRAMSAASLELFTRRLNWANAVDQAIKIFEDVLKASSHKLT